MLKPGLAALAAALALAACQVTVVAPEPQPVPGPGLGPGLGYYGPGYGLTPGSGSGLGPVPGALGASRPSVAVMRDACLRAAEAQGVRVRAIGPFQPVTGSRGVEVGATAILRVSRPGQIFDIRCSYSYGDRTARLTLG